MLRPVSLVCLMLLSLQGCFNVATTSAQAVYNRRSIQKNLHDQYATIKISQALLATEQFQDANVAVTTYNGEVLLAGQVPHAWQKLKAERVAKQAVDITQVYNLLSVENPSSTLTRISDAWITAKVKTKLISSDDVDASQIKVLTENGTVYLMGIVAPAEAQAAADIASNTDGVADVVKIFSYLRITKH